MDRRIHARARPFGFSMPRGLALLGAASLLASGVGGCSALQGVQAPGGAYVAADRATYEALAPEYAAYVAADPALADDDRARRTHALQTWRLRIEAAEQAGALGATTRTVDAIGAP